MPNPDDIVAPVKAKALLIDPSSLTVFWTNDPESPSRSSSIDEIVPMAESLGVEAAVRSVAESGVAQHLRTNLVSMGRGSITYVISLYRLPDGNVLLVSEHAWKPADDKPDAGNHRRAGRRSR